MSVVACPHGHEEWALGCHYCFDALKKLAAGGEQEKIRIEALRHAERILRKASAEAAREVSNLQVVPQLGAYVPGAVEGPASTPESAAAAVERGRRAFEERKTRSSS